MLSAMRINIRGCVCSVCLSVFVCVSKVRISPDVFYINSFIYELFVYAYGANVAHHAAPRRYYRFINTQSFGRKNAT